MNKSIPLLFGLSSVIVCMSAPAPDTAQNVRDSIALESITVIGKRGDVLQKVTGEQSRIVDPSQMSVPRAINLVPSLSQQSVDPYGLADITNYHESFRFRGVEATAGGVPACPVNVEDVPATGRPGGGPAIFDLENFRDITVYTGGMPADKGLGIADVGGKINLSVRRPDDSLGIMAKQEIGSSEFFRRTFLRVNSGEYCNAKGFASFSLTHDDKWKGDGATDRDNAMVGLTKKIGKRVTVEAFGIYNKLNLNTYRPLSYAQISDMKTYYDYDFNGNPNDYNYFDYNRNRFEDYMLLGDVSVQLGDASKLTIKPYFWSDDGYYLETVTQANSQNRVRRWDIDHDLFGTLAQFSGWLGGLNYSIGYLYHNQKRPGPPTSWKSYAIASGGLVFDKYSLLSNDSRYVLHSPFLTAKYSWGPFVFSGGLKYVRFELPSIITYKTDAAWGDVSYKDALSKNPVMDTAASAKNSKALEHVFPDATVKGTLAKDLAVYLSYGENYVTHVDIYPYFISQRTTFQKAGISFDRLWNAREMELSRNFELGLRYETKTLTIAPTAYFSTHKNKQAVLYDPALGATYPRDDASARAYGGEIETKLDLFKHISAYGSLSYNRFYFTQDINSDKDNSVMAIKNFQVPDAPEFLAKALMTYTIAGFAVSPILRYTSVRYGDVMHNQKVNPSAGFDLDVSYEHGVSFFKNVQVSATFINLLNRKDVALISTADYKTLQTSYQPVAPFTVIGAVTVTY